MADSSSSEQPLPSYRWDEFLVGAPPTSTAVVSSAFHRQSPSHLWSVSKPDIVLYCPSNICEGNRVWAADASFGSFTENQWLNGWMTYTCRNCRRQIKTFAIKLVLETVEGPAASQAGGKAIKLGEWPPFGPPIPSRVISLIGPDRELFVKGRRSENQGLGIGSFAYYRRIVENQKARLLEEISKVAKRVGAHADIISALQAAKNETQFSRAVDMVKDAIPESLKVQGHNPLLLLHRALSEGLHAQSDEDCLALAQAIRVVLTELADRIGQALQDHAELTSAVSRLMDDPKSAKTSVDETDHGPTA